MAGAAPGLDVNETAMWMALLAADYFAIPAGHCHTCRNENKVCGQFFCTVCNVGNLCKATFRDNGAHVHPQRPDPHHPDASIRVWKLVHCFCVDIEDVVRFMPPHIADRLQLYKLNERSNAKLARPTPAPENSRNPRNNHRPICTSPYCDNVINDTSAENLSAHPLCSIQCLLDDLDQAGAGVSVPVATKIRMNHDVVARAVARAILKIGGEAQEHRQVLVVDVQEVHERVPEVDVQEGNERVPEVEVQEGHEQAPEVEVQEGHEFVSFRRHPRKQSKESIRRSLVRNDDFIPQP